MKKPILPLCLLLALPATAAWPDIDLGTYQIILDRQPFGEAPAIDTTAPAQVPTPQAESFAKTIRLSALLERDDGSIKVGLIDTAKNESFYLAVGEIANGVELVSASYMDEEAVLRRAEEMAVNRLQDGAVTALNPAEQPDRHKKRDQANNTKRLPS